MRHGYIGNAMKIKNVKTGAAGGSQKTGKAGAARKSSKSGGSQSTTGSKPSVSVSLDGNIASSLSTDAAKRADKVASLQKAFLDGDLEVDSERTAGKIIQNLTDYSFA